MVATVASIEISAPPDRIFAYAIDPTHLAEWQENVVAAHLEGGGGGIAVGSRVVTTRKVGPREQVMTMEVAALDAPHGWSMRGVDGPVRAIADTTIEAIGDGSRSKVTIALDFEGYGVGKVLVPLFVRPEAKRGLPRNLRLLKERVESAG